MKQPDQRTASAWTHVITVESFDGAKRHFHELEDHGVESLIERTPSGWSLLVARSDHALAAGLVGLEAPSASVQPPPRISKGARFSARAAVLGVVAAASFSLGATASVAPSSQVSGWSGSGQAYHADDDGDGTIDRVVVRGDDGVPSAVWIDDDHDGVLDRFLGLDQPESIVELRDGDDSGFPDEWRLHGPSAGSAGTGLVLPLARPQHHRCGHDGE